MKKTDNYGARVEIENIVGDPSKVDENSLFTLLTRLAIKKGRIFDMGIILASRDDKYSGHVELAEKRLPSQSTSIQSPYQFPYDRIELRSWRDKLGVQSFGRMKGDFDKDAYFSSDNAEYLIETSGRRGCWALFGNAFTRARSRQGVFGRGVGRSLAEA